MSGHSKWATIKRAKGKTDAARANVFTKIGRELAVAVKAGGPDPNNNAKLRDVISKAKAANMPNDNITRSIKKASGELGSINYDSITYEGYGVGGVAVIVETLTDNKNRTAGDVRHIFDKCGGSMGTTGCVSYLFETRGVLAVEKKPTDDDDEMMMLALDCGADDFNVEDGMYEILTTPADFSSVRESLESKGVVFVKSEIEKIPSNYITVDDAAMPKLQRMLDMFDENDDVQNVYHNADLPEEEEEE
ncbi:MAG: YebC/PmpR family DNA-binding transcriptional regulator [Clostridia bacterium]|jgi:YebC/PmpR family DNA-binding regulatory protein|uniref:YebC/PmpR family DNA-binding transcriptional regulator n=1 Tax=Pumilibacter muris TaxID=2941510 RepID=UPI00203A4617|nr:YebC/PmpR family DNA-binding transcriptional regulator [Pumilibacter muris]MCI8595919.1 YebC/PmpR family DNA-binding transcriptional regulator [Clostridia bacterium]